MSATLTRWVLAGAAALTLSAAPALAQSPTTQPTNPGPPLRPPPPSDDQATRGIPPTDAPQARGVPQPPPLPSNAPSALRVEATQLSDTFARAWNEHDADALSQLYARDAALTAPMEARVVGQPALKRFFTRLHQGPMRDSRMTTSVDSVRTLEPDLVMIDLTHEVTGIAPTGAEDTSQAMRTHSVLVAQRDGDQLEIREMRVSELPDEAMQPGVGGAGDLEQLPEDDANQENPQDYVPE